MLPVGGAVNGAIEGWKSLKLRNTWGFTHKTMQTGKPD